MKTTAKSKVTPKAKTTRVTKPRHSVKAAPKARPKTAAKDETAEEPSPTPPSLDDILHACERARQMESELLARHGLTLAQALRLLTTQRLIQCLSEPTTALRDTLQVKLMTLREDKVEDAIRLTENAELTEQDRVSQIRAIFGR